eukprot:TRINITY_DN3974_c0_g2_i1.p1 TRINITY_DN3974_c0_g2~~TRINITY_DN3974_c0_g2_i1.p1  ORF type:complete len:353 (+),score=33.03 TRINITY_DN3974_c0_g2_i1:37-1095(+)
MVLHDITNVANSSTLHGSPVHKSPERGAVLGCYPRFTPDSKKMAGQSLGVDLVQPMTFFSLDAENSTDKSILRTFSVPPISNFDMAVDTASQVSMLSSRSFDPWAGRLSLAPRANEQQQYGMARTRSESISSRRSSCIGSRSRRISMISMAPEERLRALGGEPERIGRTPRPTRPSLGPPQRSAASRPRAETCWAIGGSPGMASDRTMCEAISEVARMPRSKSQRLAAASPREEESARSASMLRSKSLRPAAQAEHRSQRPAAQGECRSPRPFAQTPRPSPRPFAQTPYSATAVVATGTTAPTQRSATARHLSRQPCGRRPAAFGTAPAATERRPAGRSWRTDAASSGRWRI